MLSLALACGRIGYDPFAVPCTDGANGSCEEDPKPDAAPPAPLAQLCFAPRVDIVPCDVDARCVGPLPISVALADLDGDSELDLVVGDDVAGVIAVRFGVGDGSFSKSANYAVDWDAQEIRIADLDGDSVLDMVAVSWNSAAKFYRGTGDGTFEAQVRIQGPSTPVALEVVDVDSDGILDLVTGGENSRIQVMLGTGAANFAAPMTLISAENYYALDVGDLNGDGRVDIVTTDATNTLTVMMHAPVGTAWAATDIPVGDGANGVVIGDWNNDGKMDLATAATNAGQVELLLGDGSGTTFTKQAVDVTPAPIWIVAEDLNLDGQVDLVVTHRDGGQVSTLLAADGGFEAATHYDLNASAGGSSTHSLAKSAVGDLNGDGVPDIVTANPAGKDVSVLLSAPAATCP
jgi:hypothetical protein